MHLFIAILLLSLTAVLAHADRFSSYMPGWQTQIQAMTGLATFGFTMFGVILIGLGVVWLRQYFDMPSRTGIGKGLAALIFGACMAALPWIVNMLAATAGADAPTVNLQGASPLDQFGP